MDEKRVAAHITGLSGLGSPQGLRAKTPGQDSAPPSCHPGGGGQDGSIGPTCVFAVLLEYGAHVVLPPQH